MKQERNAKCACGSGIKYKKCCLVAEREQARLDAIAWKEHMLQQAEERRRKRELELDYIKSKPTSPSMRGMNPMTTILAMAALGLSSHPSGKIR